MAFVVFSSQDLHYEDQTRGGKTYLYIPMQDQIRAYNDLEGASNSEIADRYGASGRTPLWNKERAKTVIYGTMLPELLERREEINVYLPQQLVPASCNVFYFLFGEEWLVHGVKSVNDDGQVEWGISKLKVSANNAIDSIVNAVSERMLSGEDEEYIVAVTNNDTALKKLKTDLEPFALEAIRLEALKIPRSEEPLYQHRNHSLLIMTVALLAFLVLASVGVYWFLNTQQLDQVQSDIRRIQKEIRQIKQNETLNHIKKPEDVRAAMNSPLERAPSGILNTAAQFGQNFGDLTKVGLDMYAQPAPLPSITKGTDKTLQVLIEFTKAKNALLVDQEALARALVNKTASIRDVKTFGNPKNIRDGISKIELTVRVE